jgi:hypothetical protein
VFRNGTVFLASSNTPGGGTVNAFNFGMTGDVTVAGKWTGYEEVGKKIPQIFFVMPTPVKGHSN